MSVSPASDRPPSRLVGPAVHAPVGASLAASAATSGAAATTLGAGRDPWSLLSGLAGLAGGEHHHLTGRLTHVHQVPARVAEPADLPDWLTPTLVAALTQSGVERLWSHQREAADAAHAGEHVVLSTGTASGKSLGFLLPVVSDLVDGADAPTGRGATALYLSPTKALAHDQLARLESLALPGLRAATYDGDTPPDERRWVREHASYVLTNPDLLHHSLLPGHERWASFLRALRYVVVDECHVYRGVFGTHLALVLRRLRRIAARYRADPTFILASATVAEPAVHAERLLGLPVRPVTRDGSPRAALTFGLWEPGAVRAAASPDAVGADAAAGETTPRRRSAVAESADLLAELVADGVQTVAFARSRAGVEVLAAAARRRLGDDGDYAGYDAAAPASQAGSGPPTAPGGEAAVAALLDELRLADPPAPDELLDPADGLAGAPRTAPPGEHRERRGRAGSHRVAAYRGGYLPEERRALERSLRSGEVMGLAATNALELGIDISGLDAVLLAGWPGTRASLWQQAGRAGRSGAESLALFVAGDDPLDTYLVHHPEAIFDAPVEAAVVDPGNRHVLKPHLAAAAAELGMTEADEVWFGPDTVALLDELVEQGVLRRRPRGWFWARSERPTDALSLRDSGETVRIVEQSTGRVLGTVDAGRALTSVHAGAVYVHQGQTHVVVDLDVEGASAAVVVGDPGWSTQARVVSAFDLLPLGGESTRSSASASDRAERRLTLNEEVEWCFGPVDVRTRAVSFLRRLPTGEVIGEHPLDLPERRLSTKGVWWTITPEALLAAGIDERRIPGAAHAAEHAAIGMLGLVASVDRWDIGGVSTVLHPDTGLPTIMVYDGHPGGAGFAERAFEAGRTWLAGTRAAIESCRCEHGCPSCVQSPKCGNGNEPLDKDGAIALLDVVLKGFGELPTH